MFKSITKKNLLASTVMVGLAFMAAPAYAQQAQPGVEPVPDTQDPDAATRQEAEPSEVEMAPSVGVEEPRVSTGEIVVTGTLIRNPNIESTSPVAVVGEEEIELRQEVNAERLLRELPGVVPNVGSAVNNGNGGSFLVDLRGLGPDRNVVLLDGQRLPPVGIGGAVDLNNIPLALLERVDVLTGAAVTTYGADAISGVVNFITKDDFAGMELAATNQITERGDGYYFRADLTLGANFDDGRGNAVFSMGFQRAEEVFQGARDFSVFNISSFTGEQGGSSAAVPAVLVGFGGPPAQIDPTGTRLKDPFDFDLFNFNPFNLFQTPFKRFNLYGAASYEVTPGIDVYAQGIFSNNVVDTIIAPSGSFFSTYTIPFANPFIPAAVLAEICEGQGLTPAECELARNAKTQAEADEAGVPFTFKSQVRRRFVENDPRRSNFDTNFFQQRVGVRGGLTRGLDFDLFASYGESNQREAAINFGVKSRLNQALLATNPDACINPAGGCVPFNLFGTFGSITDEMLDFIRADAVTREQSSMTNVRGVISGDFGMTSPWAESPIGVAVGAEYRRYEALNDPDFLAATAGEVLGGGGAEPFIEGNYDVGELFGEVIATVAENRPLFDELTLELGARLSDYSTTGQAFTYKIGASYAPVRAVKFRGSYNKATRSPNIGELFFPNTTVLGNLAQDPCAGAAPLGDANLRAVCIAQGAPANSIGNIGNPIAGQVNLTVGGNPNLDVEDAKTYTIGAVIEPPFIPGFAATIDYYNIKVTDAVSSPTELDVINACFDGSPSASDPACLAIRRNPDSGELSGDPATTPGLPTVLSNLGRIETSGIDLQMNYRRDLGFGGLQLSFLGNWTDEAKFQATPTSVNRECVGFYSTSCESPAPEFSFNQRTSLTTGPVTFSLLWRYIHGLDYEPLAFQGDVDAAEAANAAALAEGKPLPCPDFLGEDEGGCIVEPDFREIPAEHYFDFTTNYDITENFGLTLGVFNLFDNKPHVVGADIGDTSFNNGNVYPSTFDALGRRYSVTARVRF